MHTTWNSLSINSCRSAKLCSTCWSIYIVWHILSKPTCLISPQSLVIRFRLYTLNLFWDWSDSFLWISYAHDTVLVYRQQSDSRLEAVIKFSWNGLERLPSPMFGVLPPEIAVPPPKVVVPPLGDVFMVHTVFLVSWFSEESLTLLPPDVRF